MSYFQWGCSLAPDQANCQLYQVGQHRGGAVFGEISLLFLLFLFSVLCSHEELPRKTSPNLASHCCHLHPRVLIHLRTSFLRHRSISEHVELNLIVKRGNQWPVLYLFIYCLSTIKSWINQDISIDFIPTIVSISSPVCLRTSRSTGPAGWRCGCGTGGGPPPPWCPRTGAGRWPEPAARTSASPVTWDTRAWSRAARHNYDKLLTLESVSPLRPAPFMLLSVATAASWK